MKSGKVKSLRKMLIDALSIKPPTKETEEMIKFVKTCPKKSIIKMSIMILNSLEKKP